MIQSTSPEQSNCLGPVAPQTYGQPRTVSASRTGLSQFLFPETFRSPHGGDVRALLPLVNSALELDIYSLDRRQHLVFESSRTGLSTDDFTQLSGSARQLFSYLMGVRCDADSCDLALDYSTGQVVQASWCPGRNHDDPPYHPIPATRQSPRPAIPGEP